MKRKLFFLVFAFVMAVGVVFAYTSRSTTTNCEVAGAMCARCGDGVCAKKCENARTCPQDCGVTSASAK